MSKPWTPRRRTVELRPSRIRREPVRLPAVAPPRSREQDIRNAVIGVVAVALVSVALVVGVSEVTSNANGSAEPASPAILFGQCRTAGGANCVIDGNTFYLAGERVQIADLDAPDIQGAACAEERSLGIKAAVSLAEILNRGPVTLAGSGSPAVPATSGARKVGVNGVDVGALLIEAGVAREYGAAKRPWCAVLAAQE